MPELFFQGITMAILVFFPPLFTSWSCSQCVIVCVQKDPTDTLVVSVTVYTAAAVVRGLRYCALWKGKRSHLFELSEAAPYRNKRQAFETASVPFPINHKHPLAEIASIRRRQNDACKLHRVFTERSSCTDDWGQRRFTSYSSRGIRDVFWCAAPCRPSAPTAPHHKSPSDLN